MLTAPFPDVPALRIYFRIADEDTARVLRFRRAADLLVPDSWYGAGPGLPAGRRIAEVAAECGYADHAHHDRAVTAGAEIVYGLTDQPYGSREYAARDSEGNVWPFGTYRPVVGAS